MDDILLNNYEIQKLLPHRYPIQLVDQVVAYEEGVEITTIKAIGIGEPALRGHFPGFPIMPGVLIIEALGQSCALLLELTRMKWHVGMDIESKDENAMLGVLGDIKVALRKPVFPGTLVYLKATVDWQAGPASCLKVVAYNGKNIFAKGSIKVAMVAKSRLVSSASTTNKNNLTKV